LAVVNDFGKLLSGIEQRQQVSAYGDSMG